MTGEKVQRFQGRGTAPGDPRQGIEPRDRERGREADRGACRLTGVLDA